MTQQAYGVLPNMVEVGKIVRYHHDVLIPLNVIWSLSGGRVPDASLD